MLVAAHTQGFDSPSGVENVHKLVAIPVTEAPTPNKAMAFAPELLAIIVIVLVLPVEAEVIFKKLPSTAIVAPAVVIPLAAVAKSPKLAFNVIICIEPSTTTYNSSSALVKKLYAANALPVNVPAVADKLCGSHAAWLAGADILLQAPFADAGVQVLALSMVPIQVASGPLATFVQNSPAPPAHVPILCGSQVPWLTGADILLQATLVVSGAQFPALKSNAVKSAPVNVPADDIPPPPPDKEAALHVAVSVIAAAQSALVPLTATLQVFAIFAAVQVARSAFAAVHSVLLPPIVTAHVSDTFLPTHFGKL